MGASTVEHTTTPNIRNRIRPKFKCRACQSETNISLIYHRYKIVRLNQPK